MSTEAVMASTRPEQDEQRCHIEGCGGAAVYHFVKLPDHAAETEKFFCYDHGIEYVARAHLVISENV
jgi:hypothetical protein